MLKIKNRQLPVLALAAALAFALAPAAHAETRVQACGATFPAPLYAQWVQTFNKEHPDIKVDYQAIGSGGGIKAITDRTVSFAASDAPMSKDQEKAAPAPIIHLPTVAGPEVLIYNLPGLNGELKLDGSTLAEIYLGKITRWNDPKLTALNPGLNLPDKPIAVVHRSDGSGTTFIFTNYLSKVSADWASNVGNATAVEWPAGQGAKGNDGVAASVKKSDGGLGYVESAYAFKEKLVYATQINHDGKPVKASIDTVQSAIDASAAHFPPDLKVSITDAPGANSYPICGFTYLLVYQDLSYLKDKTLANDTLDYIKWCVTDGQEMANPMGYSKLPKEAQKMVLAKLKTITFEGQPLMK